MNRNKNLKRFKEELLRLRTVGLEPIPCLDFSAGHCAWLGKPAGTAECLSLCHWRNLPEGGYSGGNMKAASSATRAELFQSIVDYCAKFGLYGVNMPLEATTDEEVAFLHAHGAKWVSLYFVQNAEDARTRFKAGADAYVTDYVSKVREGLSAL